MEQTKKNLYGIKVDISCFTISSVATNQLPFTEWDEIYQGTL